VTGQYKSSTRVLTFAGGKTPASRRSTNGRSTWKSFADNCSVHNQSPGNSSESRNPPQTFSRAILQSFALTNARRSVSVFFVSGVIAAAPTPIFSCLGLTTVSHPRVAHYRWRIPLVHTTQCSGMNQPIGSPCYVAEFDYQSATPRPFARGMLSTSGDTLVLGLIFLRRSEPYFQNWVGPEVLLVSARLYFLFPNNAVPTRTCVAPSSIAASRSCDMPIDS
jgi:hypothetical protein